MRVRRLTVLIGLTAAAGLLASTPVLGACHLAGFVSASQQVTVGESDGSVTVTVELQGRQSSCSGTVDFETSDGTAAAGSDYEAQSGQLVFESDDDRVEDIVIPITNDEASEGDETFTVALTASDGVGISSSAATATITITDDDAGADPADPTATPDPTIPAPTADATDPSPTTDATDPAPTIEPTVPSPTTDATDPSPVDAGDEGSLAALWIVLGAIIVLGGAFLVVRRTQG